MKKFHLVSLVSIPLLLLMMALAGTLVGASAPQQATSTETPPPLALPTLAPPATTTDETALQNLAQAVEIANQTVGASTSWRGHPVVDAGLPVRVGDKLPGFGLMTWAGESFRLDVVGEPLLLNFWASWCPPCVEEFPLLITADNDPAQPYRVAFINIWDDVYAYEEFLADYPDALQVMRDQTNDIATLYGFDFVPVSIFVDTQGEIVLIQHGVVHGAVLELAAALLPDAE